MLPTSPELFSVFNETAVNSERAETTAVLTTQISDATTIRLIKGSFIYTSSF